jgi:mannitol operon repressor
MARIKRPKFQTPECLSPKTSELYNRLRSESDRGAALVGAAWLDAALDSLLRKYLIDNPTIVDRLLAQDGPLSTFSARIDMACSLGLLGRKAYDDLHTIRVIRNDFGHHIEEASFNDERVVELCRTLQTVEPGLPMSARSAARFRFEFIVSVLANQLLRKAMEVNRCRPGADAPILEPRLVRQ